jgi:hypothetical protein
MMTATKADWDALTRESILAKTDDGTPILAYDVLCVRQLPGETWEDYMTIKNRQEAIEAIRLVKFAPMSLLHRHRRFRIERRGLRGGIVCE